MRGDFLAARSRRLNEEDIAEIPESENEDDDGQAS
jgi:hypothetical protein